MVKNFYKFINVILHSADSISINQKRDYWTHVPATPDEEMQKRWLELGQRFRNAADKVVTNCGKYQKQKSITY